jgi:hypothetical protein
VATVDAAIRLVTTGALDRVTLPGGRHDIDR